MASQFSIIILAIIVYVNVSSSRVIPAEPLSVMLDPYGTPILFIRDKRAPLTRPIIPPHRAMMFTGYYRPSRRSYGADQAAGAVFAQGNAVSGGSYLGGVAGSSPHLKNGPEPIDEPELSSAQAEAAPQQPQDPYNNYDTQDQQHQQQPEIPHSFSNIPTEEQHETPTSGSDSAEPLPYDIETPAAAPPAGEEGDQGNVPSTGDVSPGKLTPPVKKGKKTTIDEEEDEEDEELEDEEPYVPYLPSKGNKRRNGYIPNMNNFFPMSFSFPGLSRRGGSSSGSPPGVVTAIANSYSTGKGGVASSVATAYGGSPTPGKKARRAPPAVVAEE